MTSFFDPSFEARSFQAEGENALTLEFIESQLKVLLPTELRQIYEEFSYPVIFDRDIAFPAPESGFADEEGMVSLDLILGPTDGPCGIIKEYIRLKNQIPDNYIAFAAIAGGNMLLFERYSERVVIWLHDESILSRAISVVSGDMREFFLSLYVKKGRKARSLEDLGVDFEAMGLKK